MCQFEEMISLGKRKMRREITSHIQLKMFSIYDNP